MMKLVSWSTTSRSHWRNPIQTQNGNHDCRLHQHCYYNGYFATCLTFLHVVDSNGSLLIVRNIAFLKATTNPNTLRGHQHHGSIGTIATTTRRKQ
jgi:hypothetical protein